MANLPNNRQPSWHCVANLGDVDPFEHGGKFLMIDRRGFYPAELWVFNGWDDKAPTFKHHIVLDICFQVQDCDGNYTLCDNVYHPHLTAWFGSVEDIERVSSFIGMNPADFRRLFCRNAYDRAVAYDAVATYFGLIEFDQYPTFFDTKQEAKAFCRRMLSQIKKAETLPDGWR